MLAIGSSNSDLAIVVRSLTCLKGGNHSHWTTWIPSQSLKPKDGGNKSLFKSQVTDIDANLPEQLPAIYLHLTSSIVKVKSLSTFTLSPALGACKSLD